jgi:hypothetical protein
LIHSFVATRNPTSGTNEHRASDRVNHAVFSTVNQWRFAGFLFHLPEVAVAIEFAHEKKMFFTRFAHHKCTLWKSCELPSDSGFKHETEFFPENRLRGGYNYYNQYCSGL